MIGVVYETLKLGIGVACDHSGNNIVVKTEVEDGVHHTGHGSTGSGTNGNKEMMEANKQRIFFITIVLPVDAKLMFF